MWIACAFESVLNCLSVDSSPALNWRGSVCGCVSVIFVCVSADSWVGSMLDVHHCVFLFVMVWPVFTHYMLSVFGVALVFMILVCYEHWV